MAAPLGVDRNVSVRLPAPLASYLARTAKARGVTQSHIIRELLRQAMASQSKAKP